MRILHLTMHEHTGAGRAALRLHNGLTKQKIDSIALVNQKKYESQSVIRQNLTARLYKQIELIAVNEALVKLFDQKDTIFSINLTPSLIQNQVKQIHPDIINLHWIGWEFIRIEEMNKFPVPLVWTLHDMWAFTGGCHYSENCTRYQESCGSCPQLHSNNDRDLSYWVWQRKAKSWNNLNLTIVALSNWLANCAKSSSLLKDFRIEVIPNGIDTQIYKPMERKIARERFNLPQDKHLILFGGMRPTSDSRKGFHLLQPALKSLSQSSWQDKIELAILGTSEPNSPLDLGFKCHYVNPLTDDIALALLYAAADVFTAPSTEDNLPNTVMEAIACGTPCVAFNIGGMPDMIEHEENGYLAQPYDIEDFAGGIAWVLENKERHQKLCDRAREKAVQEFTLELQARRYLSLYNEILEGRDR